MSSRPAEEFVRLTVALRSTNAFNPWRDICPEHDLPDAPRRRRENLVDVVNAFDGRDNVSLWIARDLGYRGGRRTGLAMTDDVNLARHAAMLGLVSLRKATMGPPIAERTASVIWDVLDTLKRPVFLWNVFPLHPHAPGAPMSNRCHSRAEARMSAPVLLALIKAIKPEKIIAIGRDAESALAALNIHAIGVRHPSYGGESAFRNGIASAYGVSDLSRRRQHLLPL